MNPASLDERRKSQSPLAGTASPPTGPDSKDGTRLQGVEYPLNEAEAPDGESARGREEAEQARAMHDTTATSDR